MGCSKLNRKGKAQCMQVERVTAGGHHAHRFGRRGTSPVTGTLRFSVHSLPFAWRQVQYKMHRDSLQTEGLSIYQSRDTGKLKDVPKIIRKTELHPDTQSIKTSPLVCFKSPSFIGFLSKYYWKLKFFFFFFLIAILNKSSISIHFSQ